MPDYNKAQIYKIVSPNHEKVYYGSTTRMLDNRFSHHKSHLQCSSKEIINAGNADIKHIEWFPCDNVHALEDREAYFILNNRDGCVNKQVPGAMRRAGGKTAYEKTPEYREKKKVRNTPIQCACGKWSTRQNIKRHQRTNKCKTIIEAKVAETMNDMLDQLCVIEA